MYFFTKNYSEKEFLDMILKNKDNMRERFLERNEKIEISLAQKHELNALFYQEINPEMRFQHYNKNTLFRLETIFKNVLIAKDTPSYIKLTKPELYEYNEKTKTWYLLLNDTRYKVYTDFFHEFNFNTQDETKHIVSKSKQPTPIFILEKESEASF